MAVNRFTQPAQSPMVNTYVPNEVLPLDTTALWKAGALDEQRMESMEAAKSAWEDMAAEVQANVRSHKSDQALFQQEMAPYLQRIEEVGKNWMQDRNSIQARQDYKAIMGAAKNNPRLQGLLRDYQTQKSYDALRNDIVSKGGEARQFYDVASKTGVVKKPDGTYEYTTGFQELESPYRKHLDPEYDKFSKNFKGDEIQRITGRGAITVGDYMGYIINKKKTGGTEDRIEDWQTSLLNNAGAYQNLIKSDPGIKQDWDYYQSEQFAAENGLPAPMSAEEATVAVVLNAAQAAEQYKYNVDMDDHTYQTIGLTPEARERARTAEQEEIIPHFTRNYSASSNPDLKSMQNIFGKSEAYDNAIQTNIPLSDIVLRKGEQRIEAPKTVEDKMKLSASTLGDDQFAKIKNASNKALRNGKLSMSESQLISDWVETSGIGSARFGDDPNTPARSRVFMGGTINGVEYTSQEEYLKAAARLYNSSVGNSTLEELRKEYDPKEASGQRLQGYLTELGNMNLPITVQPARVNGKTKEDKLEVQADGLLRKAQYINGRILIPAQEMGFEINESSQTEFGSNIDDITFFANIDGENVKIRAFKFSENDIAYKIAKEYFRGKSGKSWAWAANDDRVPGNLGFEKGPDGKLYFVMDGSFDTKAWDNPDQFRDAASKYELDYNSSNNKSYAAALSVETDAAYYNQANEANIINPILQYIASQPDPKNIPEEVRSKIASEIYRNFGGNISEGEAMKKTQAVIQAYNNRQRLGTEKYVSILKNSTNLNF